MGISRHSQSTQNKLAISLQYLKEKVKHEVGFLPADKHKKFPQIVTIILVCAARHVQITQNNKFAISLQYLMKEVSDEVDFLYADKHESFLQIDTMILMGMGIASLQCLYNISKKNLEMKLIFFMPINIKVSHKWISTLWSLKFSTR